MFTHFMGQCPSSIELLIDLSCLGEINAIQKIRAKNANDKE